MKVKLVPCSKCGKSRPVWKRVEKKPFCKLCAGTLESHTGAKPQRKPILHSSKHIKKVSDKRQKLLVAYKVLRESFVKTHRMCMASLPGCQLTGCDVHHMSGKATDELYLDTSKWLYCCRSCHDLLESEPNLAKELKLSKSRLNQPEEQDKNINL